MGTARSERCCGLPTSGDRASHGELWLSTRNRRHGRRGRGWERGSKRRCMAEGCFAHRVRRAGGGLGSSGLSKRGSGGGHWTAQVRVGHGQGNPGERDHEGFGVGVGRGGGGKEKKKKSNFHSNFFFFFPFARAVIPPCGRTALLP